ncbi:MAG: SGNH/GDSL hydrolase family protein [Planctomycetes bacterium]|nr:SGNH/GDSL hydrolase family protein [Planctomycetota bacterium]
MAKMRWYLFRWKMMLLGFVLIVMATGYAAWRIHLVTRVLPMGTGPAGPVISSEVFQEEWSDQKFVMVGVGDSITRGLGASKRHSHFQLLQQNDDAQYPDMKGCDLSTVIPKLQSKNWARDFTVSQEHIDDQFPLVEVYPPDVHGIVVVTSGGNDLIHDYGQSKPVDGAMYGCSYKQATVWTENIKRRVTTLVEGLMEKFPGGCDIFLANIFDPTDGVSDPQAIGLPRWPAASKIVRLTNRKIAEICSRYENVHLVDIHTEFLGHGIHCTERWRKHYHKEDPGHWYYHNLEDPNRRGYDAIRRLYLKEIVSVFAEK